MDDKIVDEKGAPESISELLERLDRQTATMPKRLRQCAEYLRGNINLVAVTTVADMASAADVAPSAFMRFCQALGFSGYSEMQALFRSEYTRSRPDYAERLRDLRARGEHDSARLLADFVEAGHKSLIYLSNMEDMNQLARIVDRMTEARTLHLVGMRRAYPVVSYMGYMLQKMGISCVVHTGVAGVELSAAIFPEDLVFAVTFAPFASETRRLVERAHRAGTPVLLLTDSEDCPLCQIAEAQLIVLEVDVGAFRVPTVSMTLVTSIAVALGGMRRDLQQPPR